jgi:hypothetical protein
MGAIESGIARSAKVIYTLSRSTFTGIRVNGLG